MRIVRIVMSLLFLSLYGSFFLNIAGFVPWFAGMLSGIQLTPSIIRLAGGSALFLFTTLALLAATAVFGRLYCSGICPLGTLMDGVIFCARKTIRGNPNAFRPSPRGFQLALLALITILFFAGNTFLLRLTEPFSLFGRFMTDAILPLFTVLNNFLARTASAIGWPPLPYRMASYVTVIAVSFALVAILVPLVMAVFRGRLFCNLICPTGAILGIISRFSLFKIRLKEEGCTKCGSCELNCKAGCIDVKTGKVDHSRCVLCFDCVSVCPTGAAYYGLPVNGRQDSAPAAPGMKGRRRFLSLFLGGIASMILASNRSMGAVIARFTPVPIRKKQPVIPPGAVSLSRFSARCTACSLCAAVCPARIIRPAFLELGLAGMMQPVLDYSIHYCSYECVSCTEVCPSGALVKMDLKEKKLSQIGQTNLVKENCIVYSRELDCGACAERCPTQAVTMEPFKGQLYGPKVYPDLCLGCGACEYACPVSSKAIYVEGKTVHGKAKPRNDKKLKGNKKGPDFPF